MKKFLIIRFSSIGDIVLTSPVIRCLKQQVPGSEVHFITKKQYQPLLQANPGIDRLWLYKDNFSELIPQLRKERFDLIIDLHKNFRSFYLKLRLGRPSGTFPKLNIQKWLIVNFKLNFLPTVHIVHRYFETLKKAGVTYDGQGLDCYLAPEDEVKVSELFPTAAGGFTAVVIGGKHNTKIFPVEKVIDVCGKISRPVILLGGKEDMERGEMIREKSGSPVFNAAGLLTLNQSASVLKQAVSVLTNDTGLMHLAAAFRKKMVSVWGNTIPEFGMYPFLPEDKKELSFISEVPGLSCRPCSKLGYRECPKRHFRCMRDIDTEEILKHL